MLRESEERDAGKKRKIRVSFGSNEYRAVSPRKGIKTRLWGGDGEGLFKLFILFTPDFHVLVKSKAYATSSINKELKEKKIISMSNITKIILF